MIVIHTVVIVAVDSDTAGEKSVPTVRSAPSLQNVNSSSVSELPQSSSRQVVPHLF